MTERDATFCTIVLIAARRFVKTKSLWKSDEDVLSMEVREAMRRRDEARGDETVKGEVVASLDANVRRLLREDRGRRWRG